MDFDNVKSIAIPEGNVVQIYDGSYVIYEPNPITGTAPLNFCAEGRPLVKCSVAGKTVQNGTPSVQTKTLEFGTLVQDSYVSNTDGTIIPYSSWDRTDYIAIPADMRHITVEVDSTYNNKYNCWYDENKQFISSFTIWNASSGTKILTADVPSNAKYVIFSGPRNWMGSASVTYQAIQQISIQGVGDRTANLFEHPVYSEVISQGLTFTPIENGMLSISGTPTGYASFALCSIQKIPANLIGQPVTFNFVIRDVKNLVWGDLTIYDENQTILHQYQGGSYAPYKITIPDNADTMSVYVKRQNNGVVTSGVIGLMLNAGSTALPYEPYGYKIPISLNETPTATFYTDKQLYGIDTNLDYLQRLADGSGVEHRACGVYVCTGTETWLMYSVGNVHQFYVGDAVVGQALSSCYSSIAQYGVTANNRSNYNFGCYLVTQGAGVAFQMYGAKDMFPTAAEWKSYLAAQYAAGTPVIVIYQLATSTDTPVTLSEILTVAGYNTLTVGTTIQPSQVSVKVLGGEYPELENVFLDANGVIFTTADGVPFGFEEV